MFTIETRSLKSSLIRSVTGGGLSRKGGQVLDTALQNVSCTIRRGERVPLHPDLLGLAP